MRAALLAIAVAAFLAACGSGDPGEPTAATATVDSAAANADEPSANEVLEPEVDVDEQMFPDVIGASATPSGDATWTISATLSSPYDSPDRYADAWRVVGPDGAVYGERILGHDHASEQPFTRSQGGIEIPVDITEVTVEGRDQQFGWGGATFQLVLPVD